MTPLNSLANFNPQEHDILKLDSRVWPTDYCLSRVRQRLAGIISSQTQVPVDTIFLLLERPKNEEYGQFALPIPQLKLADNPVNLAKELAAKLPRDDLIVEASSAGPFLNIAINTKQVMLETVSEALKLKEKFGSNEIGKGKKVMVEYSSPNIAKPFHAGHLRSTIIGNFLKQVYRMNGFETFGINYLGDWGKQYGLLAVGFKKYGSEEELEKDAIKHLFEVYVKINNDLEQDPTVDDEARVYFKKMEDGDEACLGLWRRFRDLSIAKYKEVYKRLNIEFDIYSGESFYEKLMKPRIDELKERKLLTESKGALVVDLKEYKLEMPLIVKSDGATLYLTRDLAAAQDRFERFGLDKSIYVVSSQQDLHLAQLFKIMKLLGKVWADRMLHINYGLVNGMKTRKGQVKFLEEILDEAKEVMHETMRQNPDKYAQVANPERTSDLLGVSAVVVQDMSARRVKSYDFKIDRITQFEGDTGPYLQYAHCRLCSIERKSNLTIGDNEDVSLLTESDATDLALMIARFPEVVQEARITAEPNVVVQYLLLLSRTVSTTLDHLWVMGQEESLAKARLALYRAARITLGNGLRLIGLIPLERM